LSPIGSVHRWLVVADEVRSATSTSCTGGRVALPPITTLREVEEGTCFDEDDNLAHNFHQKPRAATLQLAAIPVGEAADCTYDRAVLSCAPSTAGGRVVLLLHSPHNALSYARPGDERWTCIPPGDGVAAGLKRRNAAYKDGLFYVVHFGDSVYALELNGPSPVVNRILMSLQINRAIPMTTSSPWGDLLLAWRFWDDYDPSVELRTEELKF
jgi:hypothetical protein